MDVVNENRHRRVFVSYRRSDSWGWAGRIYDRLGETFGEDHVFTDVDGLEASPSTDQKARVPCDFIAGMTDRCAVEFYGRSRSENPQTIFKPL